MSYEPTTLPDAGRAKPGAWQAPRLSIVVPTFNERDNVGALVQKLDAALAGIPFEVIFVDDNSPDGTAETAKAIARENPRVRCIRRFGRRGLSSAVVEGISASASDIVAVMDADLQHDERVLPRMLQQLEGGADLVIASRFAEGHGAKAGLSPLRQKMSHTANWLAGFLTGTRLSDPMTGFFMTRRATVEKIAPKLATDGFKILLDIIVTHRRILGPLRIAEVGFDFRPRNAGTSKMSTIVAVQFLGLALSQLTGGLLPATFLLFALVGVSGLFVHLAALTLADALFGWPFWANQTFATLVAMTSNYVLNNELTYRDKRLRGFKFILGLFSFALVCSLGAVANVSVASMIHEVNHGIYIAGIAGAIMSSVFNYAVTRMFTWK